MRTSDQVLADLRTLHPLRMELSLGRITTIAEQSPSPLYTSAYFSRAAANVVTAEAAAAPLAGEAQALTLDVTVTYDLPARG